MTEQSANAILFDLRREEEREERAHLHAAACHVCGNPKHQPTDHTYWSNRDALAEARAHDRQVRAAGGPVYPNGTRSAEANYVEQTRGL